MEVFGKPNRSTENNRKQYNFWREHLQVQNVGQNQVYGVEGVLCWYAASTKKCSMETRAIR